MSFGKQSNSEQQQQSGTNNQTVTPNNLSSLQTGWNAAGNLLSGTNANSTADANAGLGLTMTGANNTSTAANGGLTTATGIANGGAVNAANPYLTPTADGSMLSAGNPYFTNMVNQMSLALQPQVDGTFGSAGRYGSGADANAFNTALTNETGQLANSNYQTGLTNQLNASGQLSTNSTNTNNAALTALGIIPSLGTAATGAGAAAYGAGAAPTATFANILAMLGGGGGTTNGTSTAQGTGSSTSTAMGINGSSLAGGANTAINPGSLLALLGL